MFLHSTKLFVAVAAFFVVAGFVVAPKKSRFLLAAAVFTIAWQGGFHVEFIKQDFTITHFIFLMLFVWTFIEPQKNVLKGRTPKLLYFWGGVIVFVALAVPQARSMNYALDGVVRFVFDILVFFAVLRTLRTPKDIQFLAGCIIAALIFQGILAMLQFRDPFFKIGVIDHVQSWMWWRTKGTFFHPNEMGMFVMLTLPLTARMFFNGLIRDNTKWTFYAGIGAFIGVVALFTTYNRGSWVGTFVGVSLMIMIDFVRRGVKIKRILMVLAVPAAILLLVFLAKYGSTFADRLFSSSATNMWEGREQLQRESIEIIKQHIIICVGYWNYVLIPGVTYFVHNVYMLIASEIGVSGLLFTVGFFLSFLIHIIRGVQSKFFFVSNMSRGLLASMIGFFIASIPGPDFWISHPIQMYFWTLIALQVGLVRLDKKAQAQIRALKRKKRAEMKRQKAGLQSSLSSRETLSKNSNGA